MSGFDGLCAGSGLDIWLQPELTVVGGDGTSCIFVVGGIASIDVAGVCGFAECGLGRGADDGGVS